LPFQILYHFFGHFLDTFWTLFKKENWTLFGHCLDTFWTLCGHFLKADLKTVVDFNLKVSRKAEFKNNEEELNQEG
jgi:hypothetical protein